MPVLRTDSEINSSLKRPRTRNSVVKKRVNFDSVADELCSSEHMYLNENFSDDDVELECISRNVHQRSDSLSPEDEACDHETQSWLFESGVKGDGAIVTLVDSGINDSSVSVDTVMLQDDVENFVRSKSACELKERNRETECGVDDELEERRTEAGACCESVPLLETTRLVAYNTLVTDDAHSDGSDFDQEVSEGEDVDVTKIEDNVSEKGILKKDPGEDKGANNSKKNIGKKPKKKIQKNSSQRNMVVAKVSETQKGKNKKVTKSLSRSTSFSGNALQNISTIWLGKKSFRKSVTREKIGNLRPKQVCEAGENYKSSIENEQENTVISNLSPHNDSVNIKDLSEGDLTGGSANVTKIKKTLKRTTSRKQLTSRKSSSIVIDKNDLKPNKTLTKKVSSARLKKSDSSGIKSHEATSASNQNPDLDVFQDADVFKEFERTTAARNLYRNTDMRASENSLGIQTTQNKALSNNDLRDPENSLGIQKTQCEAVSKRSPTLSLHLTNNQEEKTSREVIVKGKGIDRFCILSTSDVSLPSVCDGDDGGDDNDECLSKLTPDNVAKTNVKKAYDAGASSFVVVHGNDGGISAVDGEGTGRTLVSEIEPKSVNKSTSISAKSSGYIKRLSRQSIGCSEASNQKTRERSISPVKCISRKISRSSIGESKKHMQTIGRKNSNLTMAVKTSENSRISINRTHSQSRMSSSSLSESNVNEIYQSKGVTSNQESLYRNVRPVGSREPQEVISSRSDHGTAIIGDATKAAPLGGMSKDKSTLSPSSILRVNSSNLPKSNLVSLNSMSSISSVKETLQDIRGILSRNSNSGVILNEELERCQFHLGATARSLKKSHGPTLRNVCEQLANFKAEILVKFTQNQQHERVKRRNSGSLSKTLKQLNDTIKIVTEVEALSLGADSEKDESTGEGQATNHDAISGDGVITAVSNSYTSVSEFYSERPTSVKRRLSLGPTRLLSNSSIDIHATPPILPVSAAQLPPTLFSKEIGRLGRASSSVNDLTESAEDSYSSWGQYTCCQMGNDFAPKCYVKLDPQTAHGDAFSCEAIDVTVVPCVTNDFQKLASKVLRISSVNYQPISQSRFLVKLPYNASPMCSWQRVVVKEMKSNIWTEIDIVDSKDNNTTENAVLRWVAVALTQLPSTLAVVLAPKLDSAKIDTENRIITSSADDLTTIIFPLNVQLAENHVTLSVIPVDCGALFYFRSCDEENEAVLCCSPLFSVQFERDLRLPVVISVPLTFPRERRKQSISALVNRKDVGGDGDIRVYRRSVRNDWQLIKYVKVTLTDRDGVLVASFDWIENNADLCIVQTKRGRSRQLLDSIITDFVRFVKKNLVNISVIHDPDQLDRVTVSFRSVQYGEQSSRQRRNTLVVSHITSKHILIDEGQQLQLKVRGNVEIQGNCDVIHVRCYSFRDVMPDQLMTCRVSDRYAQRSLESYCGFLQILAVPQKKFNTNTQQRASNIPKYPRSQPTTDVLADYAIYFPKCSIPPLPPLMRVPVVIRNEGTLTSTVLRDIASHVRDEWRKLATMLDITAARLQSIVMYNKDKTATDVALDILTTWIKRTPVSHNKATILADVLVRCGFAELGQEMLKADKQEMLKADKREITRADK